MGSEYARPDKGQVADVVVIGGGGSGLAAAAAAAEAGASVILLEKRVLGGTSAMAFGIFAAESPVQRRADINCSRDECFKVAMDWSLWRINPNIVRAFIDKSGDTIQWLEDMGMEFELGMAIPGGLPTFHLAGGRGAGLTKTLAQYCRDKGARLLARTPALKILVDNKGHVSGVMAKDKGGEFTIATGCVVIATGGFGGNQELLKKYCPDYHKDMERIGMPNTGDGLLMALSLGAATEGLGTLLLGMPSALHPPDLKADKDSSTSIFRIGLISLAGEARGILINKEGKRFADENFNNNNIVCANAIVRQPENICYTFFDSQLVRSIAHQGLGRRAGDIMEGQKGRDVLPTLVEDLEKFARKGRVGIFNTWEEMAAWIGTAMESLRSTIDEYNAACDKDHDALFAKDPKYLIPLRTPPYYAIKWGASFLNTIGGIRINERTEVLDRLGNPIPGLFSGGVDTGGWESETYCMRLPGHAFGFAINSGRIAGENAAKFVLGR